MGLSLISLKKQFKTKPNFRPISKTKGQVILEAVLSLLVLVSFLYLLQKLYEESDESIEKARLSSKYNFKIKGGS